MRNKLGYICIYTLMVNEHVVLQHVYSHIKALVVSLTIRIKALEPKTLY